MKNTIKLLGIIALAAVIVFSVAACKKSNASSSSETAVSSQAALLDGLIADYGRFVDEYVSAMDKVNAGDLDAIADLERLGNTAAEWDTRWQGYSQDAFTPEQANKLGELTQKLLSSF